MEHDEMKGKSSGGPDLVSKDKKFLWHPFTQMKEWMRDDPLIIESAEGVYLYDTEGNRYLDAVSSLWASVHGHAHPTIDEAVRAQLSKAAHTTLLGLSNPPAIELAERLVGIAPKGLTRVFYTGDGASAVEAALKMSYQYWRQRGGRFAAKKRFMSFTNGYHGDTLGAVSVGGIGLFHGVYRDLLRPSLKLPYAYCYRCHLGLSYPSCDLRCADELETHFQRNGAEVAALIVEPKVQGAAGMVVAPDGFLDRLRRLCTHYEVHLIADEVATGFGRTGKMFACEWDGVSPDIMCLGKGITGGYMAQAATLATEEIFEGFLGDHSEKRTFFHGHTYAGNPLACAAGLGSLDVFEKDDVLKSLPRKIEALRHELSGLKDMPHVGDVRQAGFMVGVEMVADKVAKKPFAGSVRMGARVARGMRKRGVFMRPLGDVLVLVLPLAVVEEEMKLVAYAMRDSIEEVVATGAGR
jgi:adenosylmethionine-8-amino-7-oxononanoate aminotransferase